MTGEQEKELLELLRSIAASLTKLVNPPVVVDENSAEMMGCTKPGGITYIDTRTWLPVRWGQ